MSDDNGNKDKIFTVRIDSDTDSDKLEVSVKVDAKTIALILNAIYGPQKQSISGIPDRTTRHGTKESIGDSPELSFAEYLDGVQPGNNFERIAAVALYHRDVLGESRVAREDVPKWFQRAGQAVPKNLSRDIRYALKRGLIAEDHSEADKYYVTKKGEELLRSAE